MEISKRKPHSHLLGYKCELKCKLNGYVVIYDNQNGQLDIDTDGARWAVIHEPSGGIVGVNSLDHARHIMKGVARAATHDEARLFADIIDV